MEEILELLKVFGEKLGLAVGASLIIEDDGSGTVVNDAYESDENIIEYFEFKSIEELKTSLTLLKGIKV